MRHKIISACLGLGLWLFVSLPSQSADWELTPYAGYRFGGGFDEVDSDQSLDLDEGGGFGLVLGRMLDYQRQFEVLFSRQKSAFQLQDLGLAPSALDSTLDIYYLQVGGSYLFDGSQFRPFISAGIGLSHFDPADTRLDRETRFSGSIGAGVKIRLSERIGIRLEGRGYLTLFDSGGSIFCSGGCVISLRGDGMGQFEIIAGITAAF